MTFLVEAISNLVVNELRATVCSSWQTMNRVPARYHLERATYPAARYRRTLVNASLTLVEADTAVRRTRHKWRMNRALS